MADENIYTAPISNEPPDAAAMAPLPLTADDKLWAMLGHLSGLLGYAVAFGQYAGPAVIYMVYKDKSKFVAFHALQSLMFQVAILVVGLVLFVLGFVTCGATWFLAAPLAVGAVIYNILGAIKANNGEMFEYWYVGKWARQQVGI